MFEERLETAGSLRQLGNDRFGTGRMEDATAAYERALYHVDFDELQVNFDFTDEHRLSLAKTKLPILLNLCQCLARTGGKERRGKNAKRAVEFAGQAIELDAECTKAWFWRGKAKMDEGDLDGSASDLAEAARLAPSDKSIRLAMTSLKMKQKELNAARRRLWGGVFKRGDAAGPAPGRQHVESAAARARGEPGIWTGGDGDEPKKPGRDGWYLAMAVVVGLVAFAAAGFAAATLVQDKA
eukprot:jgi/Undpi1/9657/HiC_scaffold_27.g12113.m1